MDHHTEQHDNTAGNTTLPTTLPEFVARFSSTEACVRFLHGLRYPEGFRCPSCDSTRAWAQASFPVDGMMICENKHQTSITAGTALHRTKQPLTTWFYAAYLVSTLSPGISALQFQRQLGVKRYETAFLMLHKLRAALVDPDRTHLEGVVEVDEVYVGGAETTRVRSDWTKSTVMLGVEIRESGHAGRIRLAQVPDNTAITIGTWVTANIAEGSILRVDGHKGYDALAGKYMLDRKPATKRGKATGNHLGMIGLVKSNLDRWLLGTHRGAVSSQHLQAYLNEFTFRFNRRFWRGPAFERVLRMLMDLPAPLEYDALYSGDHAHPGK